MNNVMVDLETLGVRPGSIILSIGAVEFSEEGLGKKFYSIIDQASCRDAGLTVDQYTLDWWDKQNGPAKQVLKDTLPCAMKRAPSLKDVLSSFSLFIKEAKFPAMWGNGSDFDNTQLAAAYSSVGIQMPFSFRDNRCYRTLRALFPEVKTDNDEGIHHNALDDAVYQAKYAVRILNYIKILKE
jgi:DNA polymerase III epsilon subunit-like protein